MSRRRRVRPEELELWNKVAGTAERLAPEKKPFAPHAPAPKAPAGEKRKAALEPPAPPHRLEPFRLGEKATRSAGSHDLLAPIHERLHAAPVRMDKKTHSRMKKGKVAPDARIDLHGMTVDRAHRALTAFILRAVSNDCRLVLVITGKGRDRDEDGPIPVRHGVLRHQLPHWLSQPPLSHLVLQVTAAHLRHGGTGAYYVYLRRNR
ncbi:Smr/MutS family protein [Pseudooceanicola sp. HF7]|uniref:Smr/MutS family protein n=1 Tax=Pseudooceanicola sp. HF7 TaxID=2721560 RepID=UPI00142F4008|nr:DNA mismatch repair protein MutS [Pseudooceanicola sp. HF7]